MSAGLDAGAVTGVAGFASGVLVAGAAAGALAPVSAFAGVAAAPVESVVAASGVAVAVGFVVPLRKSVTYQPLPFNWKPAAESILLNVLLPHEGHSVNGAALIFCRNSLRNPQSLHSYS